MYVSVVIRLCEPLPASCYLGSVSLYCTWALQISAVTELCDHLLQLGSVSLCCKEYQIISPPFSAFGNKRMNCINRWCCQLQPGKKSPGQNEQLIFNNELQFLQNQNINADEDCIGSISSLLLPTSLTRWLRA